MRCASARLRRKAVLLLLALRADEWTIGAEGGLHRPRRLGLGEVGPSASDGGLPPEGRTGVRAAPGPDRDPDRLDSYLHLEVCVHVGDGEGGPFPVGVGNVYPPSSVRRPVRLEERPFGGFARGGLPVGCRQCTDGSKMVLFVTGICSFHCFYCPVSDEKMYKDVVFADEKRVTRDEDVLEEARAIRATGAGITGGDPLDAVERTCRYIRLLKAEFGPTFHTHLYTMSTDADKIRRLAEAGLDEIRFHVPPGLWSRVADSAFPAAARLARSLGLTVGIEVPLIPEREADLVRLIEWAGAEGLAFVNLNEMEFSDANFPRMKVHGYEMKHELSYGVKGADPVALRILGRKWPTTVHYCTSGYKDGWQLRSRIKRRAEKGGRTRGVLDDGGAVLPESLVGADLEPLLAGVAGRHRVPKDLMGLDDARKRLEVAPWSLQEIAPILGRPAFLVEEYPTADGLEVERTRLA